MDNAETNPITALNTEQSLIKHQLYQIAETLGASLATLKTITDLGVRPDKHIREDFEDCLEAERKAKAPIVRGIQEDYKRLMECGAKRPDFSALWDYSLSMDIPVTEINDENEAEWKEAIASGHVKFVKGPATQNPFGDNSMETSNID